MPTAIIEALGENIEVVGLLVLTMISTLIGGMMLVGMAILFAIVIGILEVMGVGILPFVVTMVLL